MPDRVVRQRLRGLSCMEGAVFRLERLAEHPAVKNAPYPADHLDFRCRVCAECKAAAPDTQRQNRDESASAGLYNVKLAIRIIGARNLIPAMVK